MHARLALILSALWVSASSCGPHISSEAKTVISNEAKCPEDEIKFSAHGALINGDGCGRRVQVVHLCSYGRSDDCVWREVNQLKELRLRARASADFQCDRQALNVKPIDTRSWSIQGCEKIATYVWTCPTRTSTTDSQYGSSTSSYVPSYADDCTWVMNTH